MDPSKLKVVELRAELSKRGLDTKGNKPVLVKRLREALETESGDALPDTSILDTSTEECNTSQEFPDDKEPDREKTPEPAVSVPPAESPSPAKSRSRTRRSSDRTETKKEEPVVVEPTIKEVEEEEDDDDEDEKMEVCTPSVEETPEPQVECSKEPTKTSAKPETEPEVVEAIKTESEPHKNGQTNVTDETASAIKQEETAEAETKMDVDDEEEEEDEDAPEETVKAETEREPEPEPEPEPEKEPRTNRKSRWGSVVEPVEQQASPEIPAVDSGGHISESNDSSTTPASGGGDAPPANVEPRGEKRRHSSPSSPERSQRKRSRSPIREDEPDVDGDRVQLSWIDSDLNLQVNKETFTSAEPMHSDGFGYMWAGVRSTHGVQNKKVWYEVKFVENCEWKEAPKKEERERGRERDRRDRKSEEKSEKTTDKSDTLEKNKKKDDVKSETDDVDKIETKDLDEEKQESPAVETESESKITTEEIKNNDEPEDTSEKPEERSEKSEETEKPEETEKSEGPDQKPEETEKSEGPDQKPEEIAKSEEPDKKPEEIAKSEEADQKPEEIEVTNILRVGWSLPNTDLQLGEQKNSYAYDSDGFTVTNSEFTEYGVKLTVGDVIGTFLDMESDPVTISYTVNGELQPNAFTIPRSELPEDASMFPHILTRNVKFEVNFGQNENTWFEAPSEFAEYQLLKEVEEKISGMVRPSTRQECEVVMMVGLPCSGKTYWVNNHVQNNPEKRYSVLGLTNILDKMKHRGKSRKENFKGSTTVLMDKCTRCLSKLVDLASTRRRNYILDQTNLFSSAQRRKLRPFDGFRRQAVVIVVADDEQSSREKSRQQADGKDVPDSAVLEMKANMCLPSACDWVDEVTYAELEETKAKEVVQKYNKQGREAGYGPNYTAKQHHSNNQRNNNRRGGQWSNNSRNNNNKRDNSRENRNRWGGSSSSGGGGGGGHRQNNWSGGNRGNSGGWGGRHDNRNHHHGSGGGYRSNSDRQMMRGGSGGGGGYNRSQSRDEGSRGGGGYNRNRNQPHNRNSGSKTSWGGQGGGNWNNQGGNWGGQGGGWGSHQSGQGSGSGSGGSGSWGGNWSQYGGNQGGGSGGSGSSGQSGGQQWKGGYNSGQYQQQYPQGYPAGQYGGQYANWNYYGQYPQSWNPQGQGGGSGATGDNVGNSSQYNQYSQQQQAAWAQYTQSGGYGYGQTQAAQGGVPLAGNSGGGAATGPTSNQLQHPASK